MDTLYPMHEDMELKTANEAERWATESYLKDLSHDMRIRPELTKERQLGWVIYYAPARFLETGDMRESVPGAGPLYVLRNGSVVALPTSLPPKSAIEQFESSYKPR